jgi:hypothetical protein
VTEAAGDATRGDAETPRPAPIFTRAKRASSSRDARREFGAVASSGALASAASIARTMAAIWRHVSDAASSPH